MHDNFVMNPVMGLLFDLHCLVTRTNLTSCMPMHSNFMINPVMMPLFDLHCLVRSTNSPSCVPMHGNFMMNPVMTPPTSAKMSVTPKAASWFPACLPALK